MISRQLQRARDYEAEKLADIRDGERPAFHVTGGYGWINDPNGFSFYKGAYHLFYQYHPFSNQWGPMHWGHVSSTDLLHWKRLPVAMAPDTSYDGAGCFSGSALETPDGKHFLMYTGVYSGSGDGDDPERRQVQCLAWGDGIHYEKYADNPVILPEMIPGGCVASDFRDPKLWKEADGTYRCVISAMTKSGTSRIVCFRSSDALHWEYDSDIAESTVQLGGMWECPDYFPLDGRQVLCVSPIAMMPEGLEFHAGHNTMAVTGHREADGSFTQEAVQQIDHGIDFYAPQTMETPDGRRVMIGWMQAWSNSKFVPPGVKYFGQLSLPRELHIKDGRLMQQPVRELLACRSEKILRKDWILKDETASYPGIEGRTLDMTVTIKDFSELKKLDILVAAGDAWYTSVSFIPKRRMLRLDRHHSGYLYDIVHSRDMEVDTGSGALTLRFILDRFSLEVFEVNGGRCASITLFTPPSAQGIYFRAEGMAHIDVEKYTLT